MVGYCCGPSPPSRSRIQLRSASPRLGVVHVPGPPVEAMIALSILLLACEIVRLQQGQISLTSRWPWIVAFSFGLLHGFGFASALTDIGLPQGDIPLALLSFNVGVEIGQLIFIGVGAWGCWRASDASTSRQGSRRSHCRLRPMRSASWLRSGSSSGSQDLSVEGRDSAPNGERTVERIGIMIERNTELNRTETESFDDEGSDGAAPEAAVWRVLGQRRIALRPRQAKRSER